MCAPRRCPLRPAAGLPGCCLGNRWLVFNFIIGGRDAGKRLKSLQHFGGGAGLQEGGTVHQSLAAYGGGTRGRSLAFFPCLRRSARGSAAKRQMPTSQDKVGARASVQSGAALLCLAFDRFYIFLAASDPSSVHLRDTRLSSTSLPPSSGTSSLFPPVKMRARENIAPFFDVEEKRCFYQ